MKEELIKTTTDLIASDEIFRALMKDTKMTRWKEVGGGQLKYK